MDHSVMYPLRRIAPFSEWSPSIHYARLQTMKTRILAPRRIYDFEFIYVKQGVMATVLNGTTHVLEAGKLICIPAGVLHRNEIVSEPEAQTIGLHFDFFDELDIKTDVDMIVNEDDVQVERFAMEAVAPGFAPIFDIHVMTPPQSVVQIMESIVSEFHSRRPGYQLMCKALMLQLLSLLLRAQVSPAPSLADTPHTGIILELMKRIENSPAGPWSSARLAAELNVSPDYAVKLFKRVAGRPLGAYVQSARHHEARRLLRETSLSIEAVGASVGYEDIHYFSRIFRQLEGISPRQYRKLMRTY